jgi:hypothetical protein
LVDSVVWLHYAGQRSNSPQSESVVAKYVIELSDAATSEVAEALVLETEQGDDLLALAGKGHPLRPGDSLPLSASDVERIVDRFDLTPHNSSLNGWLRAWSAWDELPYPVHTGRELRMLLSGEKPLAAFVDDMPNLPDNGIVPEEIFTPYVSTGRLIKRDRETSRSGRPCRDVLYALPSEVWRMDAYLLLLDILDQGCWSEGMERMQGRLLGYTDSQNDAYIDFLRKRTTWAGSAHR